MKKLIALLLIVIMCLSLVACGNKADNESANISNETNSTQMNNEKSETENAIVGTWSTADGASSVIINSDHTATSNDIGDIDEYKWKYDSELETYVFFSPHNNPTLFGVTIEKENDVDYLLFYGAKLYRK